MIELAIFAGLAAVGFIAYKGKGAGSAAPPLAGSSSSIGGDGDMTSPPSGSITGGPLIQGLGNGPQGPKPVLAIDTPAMRPPVLQRGPVIPFASMSPVRVAPQIRPMQGTALPRAARYYA